MEVILGEDEVPFLPSGEEFVSLLPKESLLQSAVGVAQTGGANRVKVA